MIPRFRRTLLYSPCAHAFMCRAQSPDRETELGRIVNANHLVTSALRLVGSYVTPDPYEIRKAVFTLRIIAGRGIPTQSLLIQCGRP